MARYLSADNENNKLHNQQKQLCLKEEAREEDAKTKCDDEIEWEKEETFYTHLPSYIVTALKNRINIFLSTECKNAE